MSKQRQALKFTFNCLGSPKRHLREPGGTDDEINIDLSRMSQQEPVFGISPNLGHCKEKRF